MTGEIIFEIRHHLGIIRLNDPPQNLLPRPEFMPIDEFRKWIMDNGLKGIVISGKGRHFSAGADTSKLFSEDFANNLEVEMLRGRDLLSHIASLDIPVFAAISGACFGGGLEIAMACHIRIAAPNALFAFPEVNHNVIPGMGGTILLQEKVSRFNSLELLLGGDILNASEALDMRLIDGIEESPEEYSLGLLRKMTEDRPLSVINSIMKAIHNFSGISREEALKEETRMFCELAREEGLKRRNGR